MKTKLIAVIIIFTLFLQSCTKDKCTHLFEGYTYSAVYKPMSTLRTVSVQAPKAITSNGKIFTKDNFIYLNEINKGFHIIDNTNPASPRNIAFVSVPGNIDMVAKGNYLMVDNYIDLLTFDISTPTNIRLVNRKENALPYRYYNYGFSDDSARGIIVAFDKKMQKVENDCNTNSTWWRLGGGDVFFLSSATSAPPSTKSLGGANGQAGSLSRFAILNNYLYIANRFFITPINITNPLQPIVKQDVYAVGNLETLYSFNNVLLAGSPTGMFIYGVSNPDVPNYLSGISHWRGCDPVVAQNNKAYVTVRGGGPCGGVRNVLDVIDVSNVNVPVLLKTYTLENPYGLGIYNNKLGICDGNAGFKLYDATNYANIQIQSTISTIKPFDVIMNDDVALLITSDGMYQYKITNSTTPTLLSKIAITN